MSNENFTVGLWVKAGDANTEPDVSEHWIRVDKKPSNGLFYLTYGYTNTEGEQTVYETENGVPLDYFMTERDRIIADRYQPEAEYRESMTGLWEKRKENGQHLYQSIEYGKNEQNRPVWTSMRWSNGGPQPSPMNPTNKKWDHAGLVIDEIQFRESMGYKRVDSLVLPVASARIVREETLADWAVS